MITYNICTADGITNGTFAEIIDVKKDSKGAVTAIIVHFINPEAGKETRKEFKDLEQKYGKPVLPIQKYEKTFSLDKHNSSASTATAYQFPIKLATAVTSHKVQGQTIKPPQGVVMDIKNVKNDAQVYVMASRAQKLEQLFIIEDLHLHKWKASASALKELSRLTSASLNQVGIGTFNIACLNIRSLQKHFEDIKTLISFQVEVICLQETWLDQDDQPNKYNIPTFNLHLNSKGRGKGIATYFKSSYSHLLDVDEADLQITKISNKRIDIINIYRSQANKTLNDHLRRMLNPEKPTIICGDLNCDLSDEQPDFGLTLNNLGFQKLNKRATQDMGRNIDCIFTNTKLPVTIRQIGVGFSDHDLLLVNID